MKSSFVIICLISLRHDEPPCLTARSHNDVIPLIWALWNPFWEGFTKMGGKREIRRQACEFIPTALCPVDARLRPSVPTQPGELTSPACPRSAPGVSSWVDMLGDASPGSRPDPRLNHLSWILSKNWVLFFSFSFFTWLGKFFGFFLIIQTFTLKLLWLLWVESGL